MINLEPQQNFTDTRQKRPNHELDINGDMDSYTIYVKTHNQELKKEVQLHKNSTIEDAIHRAINLDDPALRSITIDDFEVYMANKKGQPKDDFPAFEKNQVLSQANFKRFVIVQKPEKFSTELKPIRLQYSQDDEFEYNTVCWCFRVKKQINNDQYQHI